ncbi:MAG: tRNA preQ1(34) S-adenosylmethionine ribosyltransferase-isomerase QueA [Burkholderiales bacterium]
MRAVRIDDFDYNLPEELIAQYPAPERAASRLLHLDAVSGSIVDRVFADLPGLLRNGDVLVMNDTRVFKARLLGRKASGGRIEIMLERVQGPRQALALLRASHALGVGQTIELQDASTATVEGREGQFFRLRFDADILQILDRIGTVPLPPYISRDASAEDEERYQTVYAREPGAVAAPTAGLHFDQVVLERIQRVGVHIAYITLHVGSGTFQPVRTEKVEEHEMHSERYRVPEATVQAIARARAEGGRVLAVGTTSLRALESAAEGGGIRSGWAETALFVRPGYRFQVVDRLLTNFHLPRSTLLMLVSAFAGTGNIRDAYRHAIERRYRFFSYGDAMLIERAAQAG